MRKRWCVLFGVVAICAVFVVCVSAYERTVQVDTLTVSAQQVERTIICDGVIEAGDSEQIYPETSCYIQEVVAQEGMYVEKGELLARIDKAMTKEYGPMSQYDVLTLTAMSEEIRAPKSGIILKMEMSEGSWCEVSAPCAVIAPSDSLRVRIAIREKYLPKLHGGMSATISGDGLKGSSYGGTLTEISSTAQSINGGGTVVEGVIELQDVESDPSLRIGLNVKAKIVTETVSEAIVIPYEAVSKGNGSCVYILSDGRVTAHPIDDSDELSQGVLVDDSSLIGKTIIMNPQDVVSYMVESSAAEDSE